MIAPAEAGSPHIYLDNAATTPTDPRVVDAMLPLLRESCANPSSLHGPGAQARRAVNEARATIAGLLGCTPAELVFTSGGTEADNLAVRGAAEAARGRHVVLSAVEHSAVLANREWLERRGFEISIAPCDDEGVIQPDAVAALLRPDTALVAVMHGNNEIGTIQPVEAIGARIERECPRAFYLIDAVQSFLKEPLSLDRARADLVVLSAHKLHGPKGVGALYVRKGRRIVAQTVGGAQESGLRAGTENVAAIVGFARAAELAAATAVDDVPRMAALRDRLIDGALAACRTAQVNGLGARRLCSHASIRFPGARSQTVLHLLEAEGVIASAGSACHASSRAPSHVLVAIGVLDDQGTIRFTLSRDTTEHDIDHTIEALRVVVPRARELNRR